MPIVVSEFRDSYGLHDLPAPEKGRSLPVSGEQRTATSARYWLAGDGRCLTGCEIKKVCVGLLFCRGLTACEMKNVCVGLLRLGLLFCRCLTGCEIKKVCVGLLRFLFDFLKP